jgi:ATP-dependent Clp protease ATP-binding subunit ClpA
LRATARAACSAGRLKTPGWRGKELTQINRDDRERGISIVVEVAVLMPVIEKYYIPSLGGRRPRQIVKKRVRPMVTDYLMARMVERSGVAREIPA